MAKIPGRDVEARQTTTRGPGNWRLVVGAAMGASLATLGATLCGTMAGLAALSGFGIALAILAGGTSLGVLGVVFASMMPGPTPAEEPHYDLLALSIERIAKGQDLQLDTGMVPMVLRVPLVSLAQQIQDERDRATRQSAERKGRDAYLARQVEAQLDALRTQNTSAIRVRDAFLARMSHELRTPLNAILGYLEMIEEDLAEDEIRGDVARVRRSAQGLLATVTTVLDLTQLESGSFEVIPEPVDLVSLASQVCDSVQGDATANGNRVEQAVAPDLDVRLDRRMLQSILFNLASNACKYTKNGAVRVSVVPLGDRLQIVVSDTGIGMTTRQLEEAYRPFGQGDASTTRRYDGAGLGLAVVRGFAEAMGGWIRIESALGKGAEVTVDLPLSCEAKVAGLDDEGPTMLLR